MFSRFVLLILLFITISINAQNSDLYYTTVKDNSITNRFVKHQQVVDKVNLLKKNSDFDIKLEGKSLEGREIYSIAWGKGDIVVLMWTQMHGDESTATMAMMDFLNYLNDESLDKIKKEKWAQEITLHIIPMLNPDGAERFQRRNALGVDLNRDALRLQNPEAVILKDVRDRTQADFGFNLHDQSRYYTVGNTKKSASFSLLAPAFNHKKDVNPTRKRAMQLASITNDYLQEQLPGHVGRYDDTFEPRAFGDNIQKWGTSVVLVECGGLKDDPEKQKIREIHYGLFHVVMNAISSREVDQASTHSYENIPQNNRKLHDLKITGLTYHDFDRKFIIDIAMKRAENYNSEAHKMNYKGYISDLGDLRTTYAYNEIDATNCELVWPEIISQEEARLIKSNEDMWKYIVEGKAIIVSDDLDTKKDSLCDFVTSEEEIKRKIRPSTNPSFYISCNGTLKYYIHNGKAYSLD